MPYELKSKDAERRFFTCEQQIERQQRKDFLHRIVTGDGYSTTIPRRKKYYSKPGQSLPSTSTSISRPNIHGSKIVFCIWWNQKGLVYYELLKPGDYGRSISVTIDSFEPCIARKTKYEQRHDKVILLHDNARLRVAKVVKEYLETLKWDVLPAPVVFSGHCSF